ncbi:MAG TPA: DUF4832 domain-containing protein [Acidobacteriaceae bacterium]
MKRRSFLKGALWATSAEMFLKRISGEVIPASPSARVIEASNAAKATPDADMVTVEPVDHGLALLNPDMGWNFPYFIDNQDARYGGNRPEDDTLDWFPGASAVYFRVGWAHLEPEEGHFNWEYTDRIAEHWIAKGKQVSYCWLVFSTVGAMAATPEWLKRSGAQGWYFPQTNGKPVPQWIPNWDDPVFLEKFGNFLAAAGSRYDGKPWLQFIEIGSLGTWGEGHTGVGYGVPTPHIPAITATAQKSHIDLWRKHFPRSAILVNHAYEQVSWYPPPPGTSAKGPVEYASSVGYGLADWSIMVQACCPYTSGGMAESIWPNHPIGLEDEHYGFSYVSTKSWGDGSAYRDAMERYHASFLRMNWWPEEFLSGNGGNLPGNYDLVAQMNRRVGYRLQIVRAKWPARVTNGSSLTVELVLRNAGVAPCFGGGYAAISLVDSSGKVNAETFDKEFDVAHLGVGPSVDQAPLVTRNISMRIPPGSHAGAYNICVSILSSRGPYRLPITEWSDEHRRYRIGAVSVE